MGDNVKSFWQNKIVGYDEVDPESLLANEANFRIQDGLKGTLEVVGWIQDIIVNKRTSLEWGADQNVETVLDGHLRVTLALRHSQPSVPIKYVDLTPNEERLALATLDPLAAMAATDREKLGALLGDIQTGNAAIQQMLSEMAEREGVFFGGNGEEPEDPGAQVDRSQELMEKWGTELGQVWELGEHRLVCGDCTDRAMVEAVMGSEKADLLWTDPPYHVGKQFEQSIDEGIEWDDEFQRKWIETSLIFLKPEAQRYVCFAPLQSTHAILSYRPNRLLVWCKPFALMRSNTWDWAYEFIAWNYDTKTPSYFDKPDGTLSFDWQEIASVIHGQEGRWHITQKPISLPERHIRASAPSDAIVLDMFLGSGTTLIACQKLGRKCRGCEISPAYVAVTIQRWVDLTGLSPRRVE